MRLNDPILWSVALEGPTALALLVAPSVVARLLFGEGPYVVAEAIARIAGIALLSLVIGCVARNGVRTAILVYNILVGAYLLPLGLTGYADGVLLWPAVVIHGVIALLLIRDSARRRLGGGT